MYHLIHPALVHFSVALLLLGGTSEACGIMARHERLERFGGTLTVLGTISLIPTLVSGYLAANVVALTVEQHERLTRHEWNGWFVLGVFGALLFWKGWGQGKIPRRARPFYVALLIAGVALAAYSAWLGGDLVYGHGVGVAGR